MVHDEEIVAARTTFKVVCVADDLRRAWQCDRRFHRHPAHFAVTTVSVATVKIAVLKETASGEKRVAASAETVRKFIGLGAAVFVDRARASSQASATRIMKSSGRQRRHPRVDSQDAGIVLCVQGPIRRVSRAQRRARWLSAASIPSASGPGSMAMPPPASRALAMEFMPRITRAQSMDILSSQSNLSGYKAVLDAAAEYGRALPDDDDRRRHRLGRARFHHGRRRCGPAGDRDRPPPWRAGLGNGCARGDQEQILSLGAKPIFVEEVAGHRGRRHRRLCDRDVARISRRRRPSWCPRTSPNRTSLSPPR